MEMKRPSTIAQKDGSELWFTLAAIVAAFVALIALSWSIF